MSLKLSVLIPMYNAEQYIGRCVESVLNQDISVANYEIIVIDDGSMDNSVEIVKKYVKTTSSVFLYCQKNKGVYNVRNDLIKRAKGEYIYFLDADDYVQSNCFKSLLFYAFNYNLDIVGFETLETLEHSKNNLDIINGNENNFTFQTGLNYIKKHRNLRHEVWWYFINKSFLEKRELSFEDVEYNGDVVFTIKLLVNSSRMGYLPVKLHSYIQTANSISRNTECSKVLKRISNMTRMILNYSGYLIDLEKRRYDVEITTNLKYRRDIFTFFTIFKMLRMGQKLIKVKEIICYFEQEKAYPINNFIGKEYNSPYYRFLLSVINNKILLFTAVRLCNFLKLKKCD